MKSSKIASFCSAALALGALCALPAGARAGNVSGVCKFEGEAPKRTVIKMDANPDCMKIHGDHKVGTENAIVSKEGQVQNVFVYVKTGLEGKKFDPPAEPAMIDQKGCMYTPHVQGIMVEQKFNIVSSDPTLHNIHALAKVNPEFNVSQPTPGTRDKVFHKAEMPIKFKCDVHAWMGAYVFVMDNPFFSTSAKDGSFTIKGLPDGEYTLAAWHEEFGTQEAKIKVAGGDVANTNFTFKAAAK